MENILYYKASPIDFEMQISLHRLVPPNTSPSKNKPLKRAFEKYKPRGLFSEFYGISLQSKCQKEMSEIFKE